MEVQSSPGVQDYNVRVYVGPEQQDVAEDVDVSPFARQKTEPKRVASRTEEAFARNRQHDSLEDEMFAASDDEFGTSLQGAGSRGRVEGGAEGEDAEGARGRTVVQIGTDFSRDVHVKSDKTVIKVDKAFQTLKTGLAARLKGDGRLTAQEAGSVKVQFNFTRQVAYWVVRGDDGEVAKKGVVDLVNDSAITAGDRQEIRKLSNEIINEMNYITGVSTTDVEDVVDGCIAPLGKSNLSRFFDRDDHTTFVGLLHSPKTPPDETRKKVFSKYMTDEFASVEGGAGAKDKLAVAKDVASAIVFQKGLLVAIKDERADLVERLKQAYSDAGDTVDAKVKAINAEIKHLDGIAARVEGMHMNPLFVGRTYTSTKTDEFQRADELRGHFETHYSGRDENHSTYQKVKRTVKRKKFVTKLAHQQLATLLAGKEVFKGDRGSYIQFANMHNVHAQQSLGMEEVYFERMLETLNDTSGVRDERVPSLGVFASLSDVTKRSLQTRLSAVQGHVRTMRDTMETDTEVSQATDAKGLAKAADSHLAGALAQLS